MGFQDAQRSFYETVRSKNIYDGWPQNDGNCLKGSRPTLSFDDRFEFGDAYWRLLKETFVQMFGVPGFSRRAKTFMDRVISFSVLDSKTWFQNYQVAEANTPE